MSLIITLLAIGMILAISELFLPGGICGCISALILLGCTVNVFMEHGAVAGCWFALGVAAFTGIICILALKLVPKLPFVKEVLHTADAKDWLAYDPAQHDLLGKCGTTRTTLRPAGIAVVDGKRVDVVTNGEMLAKDTPVKVVCVEGNRIVVAAVEN